MNDYNPIQPDIPFEQMMEKFKNIDFTSFAVPSQNMYPKFEMPEIRDFELISLAEHIEKTEEYQKQSLEMFQSINANTANLYTIVDLISKSNEKQDEIIEL